MATEDEIRARVQAADMSRSQARAEAAARIAAYVIRRKKAKAELDEIESAMALAVTESSAIMTVAELAEFIGVARKIRPAKGAGTESSVAVSSDF